MDLGQSGGLAGVPGMAAQRTAAASPSALQARDTPHRDLVAMVLGAGGVCRQRDVHGVRFRGELQGGK